VDASPAGPVSEERAPPRWSIPLGRIGGIPIRIHVTLLALVGIVASSAGEAGSSAAAELGWLTLLFASVLVHELAHAGVARSAGVPVREIDLLPIGGVSQMGPNASPRTELSIGVAGPLASIVLGVVLLLVAALLRLGTLPPTVTAGPLLVRLAWGNLLLGGFNLVPAFPLDGGRILRALLERRSTHAVATRLAARIGRLFAWALIAAGMFVNVWLVVIGFFLVVVGRAEELAAG
jgi:Zn-dependent protease